MEADWGGRKILACGSGVTIQVQLSLCNSLLWDPGQGPLRFGPQFPHV